MSEAPHIVLGVTGSIAAYKAAELVRLLRAETWSVSVIMTEAAAAYVGPLTFRALTGHPVAVGRFDRAADENLFPHIDLARRASAILVAPCTAHTLARMAHGFADDLLAATVLASQAPVLVAPAMNPVMWQHPATQANVATLRERGVDVLPVGEGTMACGEVGAGRLAPLQQVVDAVRRRLAD